jgi:hypothetical protein
MDGKYDRLVPDYESYRLRPVAMLAESLSTDETSPVSATNRVDDAGDDRDEQDPLP